MKKNLFGIVLLTLWGVFLSACVYGYLKYLQPARLTPMLESTLENALGVDISMNAAEVSIFPTFSLRLENVSMLPSAERPHLVSSEKITATLHAASLEMSLGWLSLFRLEPVIADIWLESPIVLLTRVEPAPFKAAQHPPTDLRPTAIVTENTLESQPAPSAEPPKLVEPSATVRSLAEVETKTKNTQKPEPLLPTSIQDTRLHLYDAQIIYSAQAEGTHIQVEGITGSARLPGFFSGRIDLRIARTACTFPNMPLMEFQDFFLQLSDLELKKGEISPKISAEIAVGLQFQMQSFSTVKGKKIEPAFDYFPLAKPIALRLDATGHMENGVYNAEGAFNANGGLVMNTMYTPLAFSMPFRIEQGQPMELEGVTLAFGPDKASFSGALYGVFENLVLRAANKNTSETTQTSASPVTPVPSAPVVSLPLVNPPSLNNPVLRGVVETEHFSLVYWFGFARNMLPGLQLALDHIVAKGEIEMDKTGLYAKNVQGKVLDIPITLACNLQNYFDPYLEFFITVDKANLDPLFPELKGQHVTPPVYPPPPVPLSDSTEPSTFNFGLHISAQAAEILDLDLEKVYCFVGASRGQTAEISQKGAFLTIRVGNVYDGKAEAFVTLDTTVNIRANLSNVKLDKALEPLAGYKALGGVGSLKGNVNFASGSLYTILNSLSGNVEGKLEKGFFASKAGSTTPYDSVGFNLKLKAQPSAEETMPSSLALTGNWKVDVQLPQVGFVVDTNAAISYNTKSVMPLSMKPQKANIQFTMKKDGLGMLAWTKNITLEATALTAFDLEKQTVTLTDIKGKVAGEGDSIINGTLSASKLFSAPEFAGKIHASSGSFRSHLAMLGLLLPPMENPDALTRIEAEAEYQFAKQTLTLEKIQGKLDSCPFRGNSRLEFGKHLNTQAVLQFDNLPFDHYFPKPAAPSHNTSPSAPKAPSPVPLEFLRDNDATLDLRFHNATLFKCPLKDLHVPVSLKNAALRVGPFSASFPGGGTLNGELVSNATGNKLESHLQLALVNIQLLPLSEARKQDTLMAGTAEARFNFTALFDDWNKLFASLNGPWAFELKDGYMQSAKNAPKGVEEDSRTTDPNAQYTEHSTINSQSKTVITLASASGSITNGLVACDNLLVKGPVTSIKGGGKVDLATETIDAKITATLLGIPEMPVEITGSLRDPQMSYKVAGAVAGTIGNLGGTVLGIVGGVVSAPFKLLFGGGDKKQEPKANPNDIFQNPPLPPGS